MKILNAPISNFSVRSVKSIVWLMLTVIFGLLPPIFLVWIDAQLTNKNFPFEEFVKNGSFMFFATALVASVTIDHILSEKYSRTSKEWNSFEILAFIIFPMLTLLACVILFYIPYYQPEPDIHLLWKIELYILLTTFIYGIGVKFQAFK